MFKLRTALVAVTLALVIPGLVLVFAARQNNAGREELTAPEISNVYPVNYLTGEGSLNRTASRYRVFGTDLGIIWESGPDQLMLAFGDTYGRRWGGCGAGPAEADWRSNTLAQAVNTDPARGLRFTGMIEDATGHAKELIPSLKIEGIEITIIPTAGFSVGDRNYLFYMSVNRWVSPGFWLTNYAGVAYSDDNGQNWTVSPETRWPNKPGWDGKFQQFAAVKSANFVYLFGTPNGRFGDTYLARVPLLQVMDKNSYQYWDGADWSTGQEEAAAPIISGPAGEISVQYNQYLGRWLMTYLDENRAAIVLRTAANLTGPWSNPAVLVSSKAFSQLYGAFIHPRANNGPDLYFTMSQWCAGENPYNVSLMHATLNKAGETAPGWLTPAPNRLRPPIPTGRTGRLNSL